MRRDMPCYHVMHHGSLAATADSLENALYAVKVMASDTAEAELAAKYRNGELPGKSFLALRSLELQADYDVTGPHREAACTV
jgi:hypothetical protein